MQNSATATIHNGKSSGKGDFGVINAVQATSTLFETGRRYETLSSYAIWYLYLDCEGKDNYLRETIEVSGLLGY
eukprot:6179926-Pleurochrysis_carterae.AAC.1